MRENPLCRALRVDKLTIAALAATLRAYAEGAARTEIPVLRMLCMTADTIEQRAGRLAVQLNAANVKAAVVAAESAVGGGAFPDTMLPTRVVLIEAAVTARTIDQRLRAADTPVVARIIDDRVAIDLRTVAEKEEPILLQVLVDAVRA